MNPKDAVKFYMEENILCVPPTSNAFLAACIMEKENVTSLMVKEEGAHIGFLTEGDLSRKVMAAGKDPKSTPIKEIMSKPIHSIHMEKSMPMAFVEMRKYNVRHLAVDDGKEIIGILSIKDFANYVLNKINSVGTAKQSVK